MCESLPAFKLGSLSPGGGVKYRKGIERYPEIICDDRVQNLGTHTWMRNAVN